MKRLSLILIFIGYLVSGSTQTNILDEYVELTLPQNTTIRNALRTVEEKANIVISFSPSQFSTQDIVRITHLKGSIQQVIKSLLPRYSVNLESTETRKILLSGRLKKTNIYGYIRDAESGELLVGGIIINLSNNKVIAPNEEGYYILNHTEDVRLEVRHLGYLTDTVTIAHTGADTRRDIRLTFSNELTAVVIRKEVVDKEVIDPGSFIIDHSLMYGNNGITGEKDVILSARFNHGVTSGGEGLIGLNVNGGANDENLFLLDGMPVYEVSHVAGINSIFLDESVNTATLIKSGIPARYGGRLSSVMNVQLKDGRLDQPERTISMGLMGTKFSFQGPLNNNEKTTFNLGGRFSLINYSLRPIANRFSVFEDINLNFYDLSAKLTHRFNNTSKLSATFYSGNDRTRLIQEDSIISDQIEFANRESNEIMWGNNVLSINYKKLFNAKSQFSLQAGFSRYRYFSRGYYELDSQIGIDTLISRVIDVRSNSLIEDFQFSGDYDYYLNEGIKIKIGGTYIRHRFSPSVRQSLLRVESLTTRFEEPKTTIETSELSLFAEAVIDVNDYLHLYLGSHFNQFYTEGVIYPTFQPRLKVAITPANNTIITAAYSRTAQNIHQLTNPGLGLASDLWVPSTNKIGPTLLDQISAEFKQKISKEYFVELSWFNKRYDDLIEYSIPIDLHANLVFNNDDRIFFTNDNDWRNQVEIGTGRSDGYSISLSKEVGQLKGRLSYYHNTSTRVFENINNGEQFTAKFDRPHDINISFSYDFSNVLTIGTNWVYNSGTAFSLPDESFDSVLGITIIKSSSRNNYRLPAFHQLSFTGNYKFKMFDIDSELSLGIYNAYNRLNAFYIYATNRPGAAVPIIRKVSIFPILPFAHITWRW